MAIDAKLPIPVSFQLKTLLLEEILDGRYGPDGRLPTEHQLCERHGISRTPVTRALSELATEGVGAGVHRGRVPGAAGGAGRGLDQGEYEHDFLTDRLHAVAALALGAWTTQSRGRVAMS